METIYYDSPIGILKLSAEQEFITELTFLHTAKTGDQQELPAEISLPQSAQLKECVSQLNDYFSGQSLHFNFLVRQSGTEFQQKVWAGLQTIEPGKTLSYMQLSKNLGDVKAIRAVGTANGRNKIAIVVPCHRVIGAKGELVGYAGDLWRKKWLLNHEAKYSNGVQTLF